MMRQRFLIILLFAGLLVGLAACGNKGPLYLPNDNQGTQATEQVTAESEDSQAEDEQQDAAE